MTSPATILAATSSCFLLATGLLSAQPIPVVGDTIDDGAWEVAVGITAGAMRSSHNIGAAHDPHLIFGNSGFDLGGLVQLIPSRNLTFSASVALVSRPRNEYSSSSGPPPVAGGGGAEPRGFRDELRVEIRSTEVALMTSWTPLHAGSALSAGVTAGPAIGIIHSHLLMRKLSIDKDDDWRFDPSQGYPLRDDGHTVVLAERSPIYGLNKLRYSLRLGALARFSITPWLDFTPRAIYEIGLNSITDQNAGLSREVPTLTEGGWTVNSWFFGMDVGVRLGEL